METAKIFTNGRSQAFRLPKECRFKRTDVYVKKIDGIVMLIPKEDLWRIFVSSLDKFSDDFFIPERNQGTLEKRETIE